MKWLLYESWIIEVPLDVQTLVNGIQNRIEQKKVFRRPWGTEHAALEGTVHDSGFSVNRIIYYRNSFLPVVTGTFSVGNGCTLIQLRMMPHSIGIVMMAYLFGFLGLFGMAFVADALKEGEWGGLGHLALMGAFGITLAYGSFYAEAGKAKDLIGQLFSQIQEAKAERSESAFQH